MYFGVFRCLCWAQSVDRRYPWICLRNLWIHTLRRNPWIAQISVDRAMRSMNFAYDTILLAQTYMDGLVISTNLKLNNFTHLASTIHGTKSQTVASERLHGRRSRQVPAVILLLLRTSASHRTDTWGIVDQTYNANCPKILQLKLHNKHVCDNNIAGGPANISRGPRKQLLLSDPQISAQSMDFCAEYGSIDCASRSMDIADPQIAPNIYTDPTRNEKM